MNHSISCSERFESEWLFAAPVEQVWPLLADTDRINRMMGNPPLRSSDAPDPRGGIKRQATYRMFGIPLEWDESPYEWIEGQELGVRRHYHGGPMASFALRVALSPEGATTRVCLRLEFEPRHGAFRPLVYLAGRLMARGFEQTFARFADYFAGKVAEPFAPSAISLTEVQHARARAIADRLMQLGVEPTALETLVTHVLTAPDEALGKMRPFELAKRWGTDRRELLKAFLHATKAGLLELKWDLLCPGCRGAQATHTTLSGLAGKAHCPACNIDTTADFGQSVELSFRPNPAVRRVEVRDY